MPSGYPGSSPVKNCEECMELFTFKPAVVKRGHARFCSVKCQRQWQSFAKKGVKPYEMTEETRANLSKALKGRVSPNKGKSLWWMKGDKNHNWKGGVTSDDKIQRVMFRKQMQSKIFHRDNYTCQICDAYGEPIQVDHIKSWAEYPELRYDESNCRTLCMACHYYVTFKRKLPKGVVWGHNLRRRTIKP